MFRKHIVGTIFLWLSIWSSSVFAVADPSAFYSANFPVEIYLESNAAPQAPSAGGSAAAQSGVGVQGGSSAPQSESGSPAYKYLIGIGSVFLNPATKQFEIKELIQSSPDKDLFDPAQIFQSVFVSGNITSFTRHINNTYSFKSNALGNPYGGTLALVPYGEGYMIDSFTMIKQIKPKKHSTGDAKTTGSFTVRYTMLESLRGRKLLKEFKRIHFGLRRPVMNGDTDMYPKSI